MTKKKKAIVPPKALEEKVKKIIKAGTQESLWALEKLAREAKSPEEENYVELMLQEAQFQFYAPTNKQETDDLRFAKLIMERDEHYWRVSAKLDAAESKLQNMMLDKKVYLRVMGNEDGKKNKNWEYKYCQDMETMVQNRANELRDELDYEANWAMEAKMMLKTEKYLELPFDFFEVNYFFVDDDIFWNDAAEDPMFTDDE